MRAVPLPGLAWAGGREVCNRSDHVDLHRLERLLQCRSHGAEVEHPRAHIRVHLNRAENLRAIPRSDPDFTRLYARRGDAESINRALEDTHYLNRSHSVGHLRQTADLLGFALMVNSLMLARHRAREAVKAAA